MNTSLDDARKQTILYCTGISMLLALSLLSSGCQCFKTRSVKAELPVVAETPSVTPTTTVETTAAVAPIRAAVRIKAGSSSPFTDSSGNVWQADQGFDGGDTVERPDLEIANTTDPGLYRSEHYSMTGFTWPLANGKYLVKLHFAETFEQIDGPGQRVFSFKVQGREFKDFDVWVKAGGARRAYVETVETEITDGKLQIDFISNIENPEINGIEIIPRS